VVFELVLAKRYGNDITRKIWEEITHQRTMPAIETILAGWDSNVLTELSLMSAWLYFTDSLAISGQYFDDAELFPALSKEKTAPVIEPFAEMLSDSLPRYSFNWYSTEIQSQTERTYLLRDLGDESSSTLQVVYIDLLEGFFVLPAGAAFNFPENRELNSLDYSIINGNNFDIERSNFKLLSRIQNVWARDDVFVYPQPLNISNSQISLTFANLNEATKIYIFNSNAKHLQTLESSPDSRYIEWDLKTKFNETLSTGIYLYRLVSGDFTKMGKFIIIK